MMVSVKWSVCQSHFSDDAGEDVDTLSEVREGTGLQISEVGADENKSAADFVSSRRENNGEEFALTIMSDKTQKQKARGRELMWWSGLLI